MHLSSDLHAEVDRHLNYVCPLLAGPRSRSVSATQLLSAALGSCAAHSSRGAMLPSGPWIFFKVSGILGKLNSALKQAPILG